MKMTTKMKSVFTLILIFVLANCGSDGTSTTLPFGTGGLSGFYVTSTSPSQGMYFVSTSLTSITVKMSEPVNGTTATSANIQLFKNAPGDGTGELITSIPSVVPGSDTITITGFTLVANEDYELRFFPALAAVSGDTLLEGHQPPIVYFYVNFSTGTGTGGTSIPGKPKTQSISRDDDYSCFGATLKFNETLAYPPQVAIEFHDGSDFGFGTSTAYVSGIPVVGGDASTWWAGLSSYDCSQIVVGDVKVTATDFVDYDEGLQGGNGDDCSSESGDPDCEWFFFSF